MMAALTCIDAFYQYNVEGCFTCCVVVESTKIPLIFSDWKVCIQSRRLTLLGIQVWVRVSQPPWQRCHMLCSVREQILSKYSPKLVLQDSIWCVCQMKIPAFCFGRKSYISNSCFLAAMADLLKSVAHRVSWLFSDLVLTKPLSFCLFSFFLSSLCAGVFSMHI